MNINYRFIAIFAIVLWIKLSLNIHAQHQKQGTELVSNYYQNPIFSGGYPDPNLLKDADIYYVVHSSFEYYPGLLIWKSRDLIHWTPVANALHHFIGSVWAPDLVKYKD